MIRGLGDKRPLVHAKAFVHETAVVIGDVVIEEEVNVWPCAVIRGDIERITVKKGASVQDGAVLHTDPCFPTIIGERCTVAHGCIMHGCRIGKDTLIAMGAIVLTGAEVGEGCIIGAGAVVPEGKSIPSGTIAIGIPAKVLRSVEAHDKERIKKTAEAYRRLMKKYV
ncbi:MAG: gamma carbonic anhydrase family protein [Candidatus Methanomethyliaceae archaeon]|nr:gamma carbonic anhydrase family protein [Candidatus Methanomethyliaceae archaeon]